MIESRVLEVDPETGEIEMFHYDHASDSWHIETIQDVQGLVDVNQAQFNAQERHTRYGDMAKVASVPMQVYMDLKKRGILDDKKALRRWLNDPDNRVFRTRPGRI